MLLRHFPSSDPWFLSIISLCIPSRSLLEITHFFCLILPASQLRYKICESERGPLIYPSQLLLNAQHLEHCLVHEVFYKYVLNEQMECPPTDRKLGQDWRALFCLALA